MILFQEYMFIFCVKFSNYVKHITLRGKRISTTSQWADVLLHAKNLRSFPVKFNAKFVIPTLRGTNHNFPHCYYPIKRHLAFWFRSTVMMQTVFDIIANAVVVLPHSGSDQIFVTVKLHHASSQTNKRTSVDSIRCLLSAGTSINTINIINTIKTQWTNMRMYLEKSEAGSCRRGIILQLPESVWMWL